MRLRLYFRYTTRSLRRGGTRTLLATFCIAVGVMAIVGLQLAAGMVTDSLTSNVRAANGGDVSVVSVAVPFPASQLGIFRRLKLDGEIQRYTAVVEDSATLILPKGQGLSTTIDAVDPKNFPLVGGLALKPGALGDFHQLLNRPRTMILSGSVASLLKVGVSHRVRVEAFGAHQPIYWTVGGVLAVDPPAGMTSDVLVSSALLDSVIPKSVAPEYGEVYVTTKSAAQASRAAKAISSSLPLATVSTVKQALNSDQKASQALTQFLSVAGLAALLIGGIGIINTMQVSLARRRLEIAMLKTTGYRRRDLYSLFGLEAALLGLGGGIVGALAGIGLSDAVRVLVQQIATISIDFVLSPEVILFGVLIGVATSCIFALLPIVRLSRVRPAAVLRDDPGAPSAGVVGSTIGLLAVVAALFWLLASAILASPILALWLVVGTGVAIALLTGLFTLALTVIGHLPVPERLSPSYVLLVTGALLVSILVVRVAELRAVGALLIALSVLGFVIVFLPKAVQSVVRMALRNTGRQRARTAATAVALFVGVFAVGLILVLGTDIRTELDTVITQATTYNVIAVAPSSSAGRLVRVASTLHSSGELSTVAAPIVPQSVNGRSITELAQAKPKPGRRALSGRGQDALFLLDGIQGWSVNQGVRPNVDIVAGRQLQASDTAGDGVLVSTALNKSPYNLRTGDTVTVSDPFATHPQTVDLKIVGFYGELLRSGKGISISTTVAPILATRQTAMAVGGSNLDEVVELKFPPDRASAASTELRRADTSAEVINLADFTLIIDQFLNNAILFLTAIASLALLAGIVIVANSVALALLERRREIGIQKAVGLSSRGVYAQVLVETATVAGLGAMVGMLAIAAVLVPLGRVLLKLNLALPTPLALVIVLGAVGVATATAALVAWGPVRVRPLEVLRYE